MAGTRPALTTTSSEKREAAVAVGALDPGVPYESRWAPYAQVHGPGQGQFPEGSIRPRGYMAPDARRSLARANVGAVAARCQRQSCPGRDAAHGSSCAGLTRAS